MLSTTAAGLLTGLALIIAIGAQNAHVLRQGLAREHVGLVVAICAVSDLVLILAGVAGIGAVVEQAPWAITVVTWVGVAFLTWYGVSALLRARRNESLHAATGARSSRSGVAVRTLALTLLNPHVYLDTVLLLGSIAASHGSPGRWWFALGACVGSVVWFTGLGYAARAASRLFARSRAWQVLDVVIGLTMLAIAGSLALGA
ncbi:LysE/ArgO family amino acid transporter [uncultured Nocardioides sp.]|uniref:Arginine exporter protein ArgO n=1 Tax=uncultured Nocardioides sp. TaxID=198441 RepID=A0A6J4N9X9_9ACTN|nr:LysE/ArgO family amino acid transporter [uncultured Nocardioides sp.]CAA9378231.1 MAG: Arginine exporter protein ArgO [uncultured Nocardioides sp.]